MTLTHIALIYRKLAIFTELYCHIIDRFIVEILTLISDNVHDAFFEPLIELQNINMFLNIFKFIYMHTKL